MRQGKFFVHFVQVNRSTYLLCLPQSMYKTFKEIEKILLVSKLTIFNFLNFSNKESPLIKKNKISKACIQFLV